MSEVEHNQQRPRAATDGYPPTATSNSSMGAPRGPGEYRAPQSSALLTMLMLTVGFVSRLRIKFMPQELVDEFLGYLTDDPDALMACSLTCTPLLGFRGGSPEIHFQDRSPFPSAHLSRFPPDALACSPTLYDTPTYESLVALPGGLNSCSLELFRCGDSRVILDACSHGVTSIS